MQPRFYYSQCIRTIKQVAAGTLNYSVLGPLLFEAGESRQVLVIIGTTIMTSEDCYIYGLLTA